MRLVDRVAYINHDIDDAVRAGILAESDLPAKQIELLGPTGAARIDTLVRDIVDTLARARRHRPVGGDRRGDAAAAQVHVRAASISGRRRAASTTGCTGRCAGCSTTTSTDAAPEGGDELQRVTDYIAGMTDRYAIATFRRVALPEESRL